MNRLLSFLFVCLMHVSLAVASTYNLSVEVTPNGSGSLSTSGGTYEEGSTVYLRTYGNTGYVFKGWYDGETLLSSSSSFNYTMPAKDVLVKAKYEYDPTVPGNPSMPDTTTYYSFNAIVSPHGAGSLNSTNARYVAGATVSLRTYNNTGYKFVGWQDANGVNLSSSTSYNYTMPNHDVTLTALYSYDPSVPANPDSMATRYTVNVVSKPMGGGSFNTTSATVEEGGNVRLYAYTNTGYQFLHWENEQGDIISSEQNFYYIMPHGNTRIYGVFDYNPAPPSNPSKNYWNKDLGEVIIDDFTPGYLGSAVSNAISGSNRSDVAMITVAGRMNDNDFGVANDYTNCTLLDLSRVTGITNIPSYAFDYTNLESVYLPATIENIGYRAFADCKQLTALTVYAMVPPTLESNVFQGVQEGLVVYVPAASIAQYQDADGWKNFTILPIQEDIRSLSISLPNGVSTKDYSQMWLELTNTKSGQKMHYVMTDRSSYTFANIIRNTSWNAVLRNQRGDVFGKIDNIEVKDEDVSVVFSSLSKPQNVSLTVKTPNGETVTSNTQITWLDSDGNYLAQSTGLSGLLSGYAVNYRVVLSQDLAMQYVAPEQKDYIVSDANNNLTLTLEPIKQVTISGCVKDLASKTALSGATVTASQTFGGKYSKTVNTKTDAKGNYVLTVSNVPTSLAVSASDYISQTIVCDSLMTGEDVVTISDVSLKGISGAVVTLGLTYTKCPSEGGNEDTFQEWYADYNNVAYSIYNKTKQKSINQFNVQYPQIVLLEEVDEGDVLEMTATSKVNAFMPVKTTATIDAEQRANATFNIVELGRIKSAFAKNSNVSVVGSLYDANGKLVKSYDYSNASLTINDLTDGSYTLVTMGASKLFNSIYDLSQLPQTGLVLGSDYTQTTVDVKSGKVCAIDIAEVPTLDESKLYYTGDNTSFTVNKSSIVVGNYLTLTGHLDFKSAYAGNVSNVNLIVDLPESCEFVENSVMVGNNTSSYIIQDNRITIPMARYTDRVRFCIIPTLDGEYAPSALAQFDIDGETVTQPIGSANYTAKDLSINVPSTVAKTTIPVSGTAIGVSTIEIYDGDVLIGQTTSMANGVWSTTCELNDAFNLSTHSIHAKIITKNGLELNSEIIKCLYDEYTIQVSKVTMYHDNPEMHKTYTVVFDFLNPNNVPQKYTYYIYNKTFTFTIDFTTSNPDAVTNVVLWVKTGKGNLIPLEAFFDEAKECWVATGEFGNMYDGDIPVNVSVDYDALLYGPVSRQLLTDAEFDYNNYSNIQSEINVDFDNLEDKFNSGSLSNDDFELLFNQLTSGFEAYGDINYSNLGAQELLALSRDLMQQSENIRDSIASSMQELISMAEFNKFDLSSLGVEGTFEIDSTDGLSPESLIENGFEAISIDDNSFVYRCVTDTSYEIVDFVKGKRYSLTYGQELINLAKSARASGNIQVLINKINEFQTKVNELVSIAQKINAGLGLIPEFFNGRIAKIALAIEENRAAYQALQYFEGMMPTASENLEISEQITKLKGENIKLGKEKAKLLANQEEVMKAISKVTVLIGAFLDAYSTGSNANAYINLWYEVPSCPCDMSKTESLQNEILNAGLRCAGKDIANIVGDLVSVHMIFGGVTAAPTTGGTSLILAVSGISLSVIKGLVNHWADKEFEKERARFRSQISSLAKDKSCFNCPDPDPKPNPDPEPPIPPKPRDPKPSGNPDSDPSIDPSGFVYEGVFSNRLEGVTATAYYKEMVEDMYGDLHESIVKWDAEEYAQENPLFTDENGYYRWDVPQGLWQVKFEKEGYETTYSEWLPVPPPQLDVNIAMKQNVQPNVKYARAYEDAVEVEFDKYMMPEMLNTDNIIVMAGDKQVEGSIELLNEEVKYEGESETFASKLRFNATAPFEGTEVTLMVNNRVKSYAGIRMQDNYSQSFTIEQEIRKIVCDSATIVRYGDNDIISITVLPTSASAGKTINVRSSSQMILGTDVTSVVLDANGKADIPVSGELPGTAALTFSIDGYGLSATTIVNVEQIENVEIEAPKANIASGTTVTKGTAVTLTCATEGATIYYTLDRSCPCEETTRLTYTEPIVINKTVTIKAMAVAPDLTESDIVEFTYIVDEEDGIDEVTLDTELKIYPLPVRDKLNVTAGGKTIKNVALTSMNGSTVVKATKPVTMVTLDVSSLTPGIYIINVTTDDKTYSRKIMKVE